MILGPAGFIMVQQGAREIIQRGSEIEASKISTTGLFVAFIVILLASIVIAKLLTREKKG